MVTLDVRKAESAIDADIRALKIWKSGCEATAKAILDTYRDIIEVIFLRLHADSLGLAQTNMQAALMMEHHLHTGVFWLLKWTFAWCPENGNPAPAGEEIEKLIHTGSSYQNFVDALWVNKTGRGRVEVNIPSQSIVIFEGGDQTGRDRDLASYINGFVALNQHNSFTEDGDKLTSSWTAGDYRALGKDLLDECTRVCGETVQFSGADPPIDLFKRPVVVRIPDSLVCKYEHLIQDLALSLSRLANIANCWRLMSWFDTPLIYIGGVYWCPSNILQTVFGDGQDDHMLRLAALVDAEQYTRVSQLREERMRVLSVKKLKARGWICTTSFKLKNPAADIDIHAVRDSTILILELKSTLRPETPREVASRNDDILLGLKKSEERRARFPVGAIAAVVTDGYRGDYLTWADALRRAVPVVTMDELDAFALNPWAYVEGLQRWAATRPVGANPLPERETKLLGWRIIVRDQP